MYPYKDFPYVHGGDFVVLSLNLLGESSAYLLTCVEPVVVATASVVF